MPHLTLIISAYDGGYSAWTAVYPFDPTAHASSFADWAHARRAGELAVSVSRTAVGDGPRCWGLFQSPPLGAREERRKEKRRDKRRERTSEEEERTVIWLSVLCVFVYFCIYIYFFFIDCEEGSSETFHENTFSVSIPLIFICLSLCDFMLLLLL